MAEHKAAIAVTEEEMRVLLENASELVVPQDAMTWTRDEFELFVTSGGMLRPRSFTNGLTHADAEYQDSIPMGSEKIEYFFAKANIWLAQADAVLIGSGAGMGVDSGLATFRGSRAGVWPMLEAAGLSYEDICNAKWFVDDPRLAWSFWNFCINAYKGTKPHQGYDFAREIANRAILGAFAFTSNIDGHWLESGWDSNCLVEVHGSVKWMQCSQCSHPEWETSADLSLQLQEDVETHRLQGELPTCPSCGAVARPCVQMFGKDSCFSKRRRRQQVTRYDDWLKKLESRSDKGSIRLVCLEIGCGTTVPTVRKELTDVLKRFPGARLIRLNPENYSIERDLQDIAVPLPLLGMATLKRLSTEIAMESNAVTVIIWDSAGNGVEFTVAVVSGLTAGQLLRHAEFACGGFSQGSGSASGSSENRLSETKRPRLVYVAIPEWDSKMVELEDCDMILDEMICKDLFEKSTMGTGKGAQVFQRAAAIKKKSDYAFLSDSSEEDDLPWPRLPTNLLTLQLKDADFPPGFVTPILAARMRQVNGLLDELNSRFQSKAYQQKINDALGPNRLGVVLKAAQKVQLDVLPIYGLGDHSGGIWAMQILVSTCALGSVGLMAKTLNSMHLSRVIEARQALNESESECRAR
jgi:NAD-dependent SIR2 family protein deacetylase